MLASQRTIDEIPVGYCDCSNNGSGRYYVIRTKHMKMANRDHIGNLDQSLWAVASNTVLKDTTSRVNANEAVRTAQPDLRFSEPAVHLEGTVASVKVPNAQSYGGVLFSADGRVLLRQPIDCIGGYVWTWPKGKPEQGENPLETALREVHEETGYHARIIRVLPRAYIGTTRTSAFFLMEPVGEQGRILNETAETRWANYDDACVLIDLTKHAMGRNRDRSILDDAFALWLTANIAKRGTLPISGSFQFITL